MKAEVKSRITNAHASVRAVGCLLTLALLLAVATGCGGVPRLSTFEKGVEYMDYSDYPRAIEQFKSHINKEGEGLAVCYNLGVCYFDQQDYDQAVVWYERALEYDPRDGDTLVNLGLTYLEQGRDVAKGCAAVFVPAHMCDGQAGTDPEVIGYAKLAVHIEAEEGGVVVAEEEREHGIVDVDIAVAEVDPYLAIRVVSVRDRRGCGCEGKAKGRE